MTVPSPGQVRDGLARCFLRNGADRPQWLADLAEPIVCEVLEERDELIARLRAAAGNGSEEGECP